MKKFFTMAIMSMLIIAAVALTASAESVFELNAEEITSVEAGQTLTIDISVDNITIASGLEAVDFVLTYNEKLTYSSATAALPEGWDFWPPVSDTTARTLSLACVDENTTTPNPVTEDGAVVFSVTFTVASDFASGDSVTIDFSRVEATEGGETSLVNGTGNGTSYTYLYYPVELTVTTPPTTTIYYENDTLDVAGMVVTATMSDGTTVDVTAEATVEDVSLATVGTKTVTVTYGELTTTFEVTVKELPTIRAKSATLLYNDFIQVRYTFAVTGEGITEKGMYVFASAEDAATYDAAKAKQVQTVNNSGYGYTDGIAAKEMGDSQFVVGYVKTESGRYIYGNTVEYSPKIYAQRMVGKSETDAPTKALCNALMYYGAAAQNYMDYKTDNLMNEGFDAVEYNEAVLGEEIFSVDTTVTNGLKINSATLIFEGAITYRVKFTPSGDATGKTLYAEYVMKSETKSVEIEKVGSAYYAYISGIAAKDMDEALTVRPYYVNENGEKVYGANLVYSGYEYARRTIASSSQEETAKELARAFAMYVDAANTAIK